MRGNPKPPRAHDYNDRLCATVDYLLPDGKVRWLLLWHRTPGVHEWLAGTPAAHELSVAVEDARSEDLADLTAYPSLHWPECCGMHGFLTNGTWRDA